MRPANDSARHHRGARRNLTKSHGNHIGSARASASRMTPEVPADLERCCAAPTWRSTRPRAEGRGRGPVLRARNGNQGARMRRELEFDLRHALENDEFELHFQPIFNVAKRRFLGCEALMRWRHATRGLVSPGVFVPIAEEMGLILRSTIGCCARPASPRRTWPRRNQGRGQRFRGAFPRPRNRRDRLKARSRNPSLSPSRLEIEITETALLQNLQMTRSVLHELRKLGVRISLDDFGTGYSSLSYLHTLAAQQDQDRPLVPVRARRGQPRAQAAERRHSAQQGSRSQHCDGRRRDPRAAGDGDPQHADRRNPGLSLFRRYSAQAEITELFEKKQRSAA